MEKEKECESDEKVLVHGSELLRSGKLLSIYSPLTISQASPEFVEMFQQKVCEAMKKDEKRRKRKSSRRR